MLFKHSLKATLFSTLLFGLICYTNSPAIAASELSGYVYLDLDFDGYRDSSEVGLSGVEIQLTKLSDPGFSAALLSDQNGYYEFTSIDSGVYSLTQPALPLMVRNVFVREGDLRSIVEDTLLTSYAGTAKFLDQAQGILPHIEGIELPEGARGSNYNFGQICLGKAWYTTEPPPLVQQGVPEPSTGLLAIVALLLGASQRRKARL